MTDRAEPLPPDCPIAFKEWSGVCAALESGRQSIILRKGGIAEVSGGFAPEHPAFWLYPTHVHENEQGLRDTLSPVSAPPPEGAVDLGTLAVVDVIGLVDQDSALPALYDLHVWTEETVRKRFFYRRPGLWVLGVRVYRKPEPFRLEVTPEFAGCKTWVELGRALPTEGLSPVLPAEEHRAVMGRLRSALRPHGPDAPERQGG